MLLVEPFVTNISPLVDPRSISRIENLFINRCSVAGVPVFVIRQVADGQSFRVVIYANNAKGPSPPFVLMAQTPRPAERYTGEVPASERAFDLERLGSAKCPRENVVIWSRAGNDSGYDSRHLYEYLREGC